MLIFFDRLFVRNKVVKGKLRSKESSLGNFFKHAFKDIFEGRREVFFVFQVDNFLLQKFKIELALMRVVKYLEIKQQYDMEHSETDGPGLGLNDVLFGVARTGGLETAHSNVLELLWG